MLGVISIFALIILGALTLLIVDLIINGMIAVTTSLINYIRSTRYKRR